MERHRDIETQGGERQRETERKPRKRQRPQTCCIHAYSPKNPTNTRITTNTSTCNYSMDTSTTINNISVYMYKHLDINIHAPTHTRTKEISNGIQQESAALRERSWVFYMAGCSEVRHDTRSLAKTLQPSCRQDFPAVEQSLELLEASLLSAGRAQGRLSSGMRALASFGLSSLSTQPMQ